MPPENRRGVVDRSAVIGAGLKAAAAWSARFLLIGVGLAAFFWLVGQIWVVVLPILLALIFSSVLWPLVQWLQRRRWPAVLAAAVAVLGSLAAIGGVIALIVRPMIKQSVELADSAANGLEQVRNWLAGPPLNIGSEQIDAATNEIVSRLQSSAEQIAAGVLTGVSAVTSGLVTFLLVLVLSFLILKDGTRFLPWLRRQVGRDMGTHLTEVMARSWATLGSFIRVQAIVSFVDAVLIGLGLWALGVPLAAALAVLTFLGGFIPIVGAVAVGVLSVLVALVSNGPTTALLVLGLILLVQQLESNVLQPFLQGRSLQLHAAVVLLAVTLGGTLFGIAGAFLAVPVAAVVTTVLRYSSEQVALRSGEIRADELKTLTKEGGRAARAGEQAAHWFRQRSRRRASGRGPGDERLERSQRP